MPRPKKVWIADDDESIRFILEKGLLDAGFHVNVFEAVSYTHLTLPTRDLV